MAAGHTFVDGRCSCGRLWLDIRNTTREDIGSANIAHTGNLTENEYSQIEARRQAEDERIQRAMAIVTGA